MCNWLDGFTRTAARINQHIPFSAYAIDRGRKLRR